jgi:hypothetical protein
MEPPVFIAAAVFIAAFIGIAANRAAFAQFEA